MNLPFGKLIDPNTWLLRSGTDRRKEIESLGISLEKEVCVMGLSGIAASAGYGALKDLSSGRLTIYDGSWAEFSKF